MSRAECPASSAELPLRVAEFGVLGDQQRAQPRTSSLAASSSRSTCASLLRHRRRVYPGPDTVPGLSANGEILWMLAVHLALTGAPGIAAALAAMRLGVRDVPVLLAIALAASGVAAFLAFWAYFADPTIGAGLELRPPPRLDPDRRPRRLPREPRPRAAAPAADTAPALGPRVGLHRLPRLPPRRHRKRDRDVGDRATPAAFPPTTTSRATSPNGSRRKATTGRRRSTRPTG